MNFRVKTGRIKNVSTGLLAVFMFEESRKIEGWLEELNEVFEDRIREVLKMRDFKGELNENILLYAPENSRIKRVLLVGLGKKREFNSEKVRQVIGTASKKARSLKLKYFTVSVDGFEDSKISKIDLAHAAAEGSVLSLYQFIKFKTENLKKYFNVTDMTVFDSSRKSFKELSVGVEEGSLFADGVCYARDLASYPSNVVTPKYLAKEAQSISKENGLKCIVLDEKRLKSEKMNAFLGVAKGSKEPPRLICMEYNSGIENAKKIAFVGKGLTFDSGGISIKPSKKMEEMKYDMCGAAAVLGVMKLLKVLKPQVDVVGIVAAAENLPGGNAQKPGDIVSTYSGLTVEVINTDAEGRLVLADALAYTVDKFKPDAVIDLATLTGAVVIALGHYATGMLGNNTTLLNRVKEAGERSGEMVWELPLYPEFDEHLKSDFADIKNSNGPGGGTIFGAAFLKKFIKKTHWVHLDIAGTAWDVKERSYMPKGPTGVGVRLLARLLKDWK
ncbi:leucyl aminopeptidase [candidate division KSB1 bacterium]